MRRRTMVGVQLKPRAIPAYMITLWNGRMRRKAPAVFAQNIERIVNEAILPNERPNPVAEEVLVNPTPFLQMGPKVSHCLLG